MNAVQLLCQLFDDALTHDWESLASVTHGLTDAEAARRHPAYASEPHDDGIGKPGTVLWFLNHLLHYHRHYTAILRARPIDTEPQSTPPGELPLAQVLPALKTANAELRAEFMELRDADLDQPCSPRRSTAEFVLGIVRHIAWHGGQIATLRRLLKSEG